MDGRVVGVNSAIFSKSGGSLGIGFAIPAEMVRAVLAAEQTGQVSKRGVVRPWLGFSAQSVTADIATSLGFERPMGALVADVAKDGPADAAGLKRGDVITAIDGRQVRDAEELKYRIATLPIGTEATLSVRRESETVTLIFTASPPPETPSRAPVTIKDDGLFSGATIINVSPAVIEEMGLENQTDGVVIYGVLDGSPAQRVGLEAGDGIIALGNRRVTDTAQFARLLGQYDARRGWVITIRRDGRDQTIILR